MNAGHFSESHVSSGDLNRPRESRGSQPSACFCGTFCTPQKVPTRFPYGKASRFCEPRISAQNYIFAQTKLKPFSKKDSRFSKPRISPPKQQLHTNKIKSFRRPWRHFPVATATLLPLCGFSTALGGTFCCCRNIFPPCGGVPAGTARSACRGASRFCKPRTSSPQ